MSLSSGKNVDTAEKKEQTASKPSKTTDKSSTKPVSQKEAGGQKGVKTLKEEGLHTLLEFTVEAVQFQAALATFIAQKGKNHKMPGFRPGKVPQEKLIQLFAPEGFVRVPDMLAQQMGNDYIRNNKIAIVGRASYTITKPPQADKPKEPFVFTLSYEKAPATVTPSLDNLRIEEADVQINDTDIQEVMDKWVQEGHKTQSIKDKRPVQVGDILCVDITSTPEKGDPQTMANIDLLLTEASMGADLVKKFIGVNVGESVHTKTHIPKNVADKKLAGKKIPTVYTLKEIKEKVPLAGTQDLPAAFNVKDGEAVKEKAGDVLLQQSKQLSFLWLKRQIFDFLAVQHQFDVPQSLLDSEYKKLYSTALQEVGLPPQPVNDAQAKDASEKDASRRKASTEKTPTADQKERDKKLKAAFEKTEVELQAFFKAVSVRRVRLGFLLSALGKELGVVITEEETRALLMKELERHRGNEKNVVQFYKKNPGALENLKLPLFEDKAVRAIAEKCTQKEKSKISFKDLEARLEEEEGLFKPSEAKARKGAKQKTKGDATGV